MDPRFFPSFQSFTCHPKINGQSIAHKLSKISARLQVINGLVMDFLRTLLKSARVSATAKPKAKAKASPAPSRKRVRAETKDQNTQDGSEAPKSRKSKKAKKTK